MDNIQSSPQIEVPNVPADFCPKGTLQYIFQQFVDVVLKNATLSVPGLGDVTPEEIQQINTQLDELQNQINANIIYFRSGEFDVNAGDETYDVAFVSTEQMPSGDYAVGLTFWSDGTIPSPPEPVLSLIGSQTIAGFSVRVENGIAGWKVKWHAIQGAA